MTLIPKDEWERKIFCDFAAAAGLALDSGSVASGVPPQPDIRFSVDGVERWAELVSTPVENLTVPPGENLTDRRGDEPQFVVPS